MYSGLYNNYESCNIKPVSGYEYVTFNSTAFDIYSPFHKLSLYGGNYSGSVPVGDVYINGSGIDWMTDATIPPSTSKGWQFCIAPTPAAGQTWLTSGTQCHVTVRQLFTLPLISLYVESLWAVLVWPRVFLPPDSL